MGKSRRTRRVFKIAGLCLLLPLSYCVLHVLLVAWPRPLFRHGRSYKNFSVYMRQEVPPEITTVLDRVESLLARSELNEPDLHHEVTIINSFRMSRWLLLRNVHFGCNVGSGDTFVTMADVERDRASCEKLGPNDHRRRTLSETITHEITHALIRRRLGMRGDWALPTWIKEGYCETISQGSAIDHATGLAIIAGEAAPEPGFWNFKHRLMVEHLMDDRGLTFDDLVRDPPDYQQVSAELARAVREERAGYLRKLGIPLRIDSDSQ